ncbi:single-stranded DNA-binding protein [Sporocytophaga myxococcoides]|uniref:Single-stranded DNA-binding protein n=1 Tax=Sporocytophaga myxococcoides TaxID=153721 RepID=A0A098LDB1_9BACT|nr:single-stranded DNA-binding protein [Sporocytophaga myxococcoides]GAL84409.1 single-stranded DNA-binding protein [Sporocytophaga myxococcoides]
MSGVNKVILVGRLGKDPEIRVMESGRKVASFTLATSEVYKDKNGERVEQTEWHNVSFWGPIADVIEKYLKKGNQLYVEGKLRTRSYEDKEGVKKYTTEIIGQNMSMLGGGGARQADGGEARTSYTSEPVAQSASVDDDMDDLPF